DGPRALLNGSCYVFSSDLATMQARGSLRYCYMVSAEMGSLYQTQLLMEVSGEPSPVFALGSRDVILFIGAGSGTVTISGRTLPVKATDGVYIRPAEAVQLTANTGQTLKVFVLACPLGEISWLDEMPANFDTQCPERVVTVDPRQRT